ncbi:HTH domain-containing protein [Selenomonas sp. KH1T6]|uniref:HTH domain-containing protein n=1 Tax=Selenomonas sp. KH1T6 TaxID=3158784 RepID=UPI000944BD9B
MLTPLYYQKEILKSLLSGVPTSLPGGFNSRSLFMGLVGRWADYVNLPVKTIAEAFGVTPQAVYGNINRLSQLEARIDAQPDIPANCIIITPRDIE